MRLITMFQIVITYGKNINNMNELPTYKYIKNFNAEKIVGQIIDAVIEIKSEYAKSDDIRIWMPNYIIRPISEHVAHLSNRYCELNLIQTIWGVKILPNHDNKIVVSRIDNYVYDSKIITIEIS